MKTNSTKLILSLIEILLCISNASSHSYDNRHILSFLRNLSSCSIRNCETCEPDGQLCSKCLDGYDNLKSVCRPSKCLDNLCESCPIDNYVCAICKNSNEFFPKDGKCIEKCATDMCKTCVTSLKGEKKCTSCNYGFLMSNNILNIIDRK